MSSRFYLVIGNRDNLNLPDGKIPIWEVLDGGWPYFLTSLWYARRSSGYGDASGGVIPPWADNSIYDCGAWSYKTDPEPKWTPGECLELYESLASPMDIVVAPDHMIFADHDEETANYRRQITLQYAREFLQLQNGHQFQPMAVIHGQSLLQRLAMAAELLDIGYRHLALGGIARLASSRKRAIAIVEAITRLKDQEPFWLHVLGISAPSYWDVWHQLGVDSFDGTGPFRPAFFGCYLGPDGKEYSVEKDGRKNSKKQPPATEAPPCDCLACETLAQHEISVRTFGSNEHNMGRAVHNVNMYLRRLRAWEPTEPTAVQRGLL